MKNSFYIIQTYLRITQEKRNIIREENTSKNSSL